MGRAELPEQIKWQIIGLLKGSLSQKKVATLLNISRCAVQNTWKKYTKTGDVKEALRSGRPRKTSPRTDRYLHRAADEDRTKSALQVRDTCIGVRQHPISPRTVQRRLRESGFRCRFAVRRQKLTEKHAKARKKWCAEHLEGMPELLNRLVISDESNFQLENRKNRTIVRIKPGEPLRPDCVQQEVQKGGGSVGIWGCISMHGAGCCKIYRGTLKKEGYSDILRNELVASKDLLFGEQPCVYQQDNARIHTSRLVQETMGQLEIDILPWPSRSPDLSPIENIWSYIDRQLQKRPDRGRLRTHDELEQALLEEWNKLTPDVCQRHLNSMPQRMRDCIAVNGWYF
jgi:transposase